MMLQGLPDGKECSSFLGGSFYNFVCVYKSKGEERKSVDEQLLEFTL